MSDEQEEQAAEESSGVLVLSELRSEAAEAVGLRCPSCGCRHLVVTAVRQQFDEAKRFRKCRNCGKTVKTFERIA